MARRNRSIPATDQRHRAGIDVSLLDPGIAGTPVAPEGAALDHHLWRNGRRWWIAFTVHRGHQQERVRFSLKTEDITIARRRRDCALALVQQARDCEISLRFPPRRAAEARP